MGKQELPLFDFRRMNYKLFACQKQWDKKVFNYVQLVSLMLCYQTSLTSITTSGSGQENPSNFPPQLATKISSSSPKEVYLIAKQDKAQNQAGGVERPNPVRKLPTVVSRKTHAESKRLVIPNADLCSQGQNLLQKDWYLCQKVLYRGVWKVFGYHILFTIFYQDLQYGTWNGWLKQSPASLLPQHPSMRRDDVVPWCIKCNHRLHLDR